jgi:hypothetical protein
MHFFQKKTSSKQTIAVYFLSILWLILLMVSSAYANGAISTFGYDDLHRLTGTQHKKGTEVLSQFNYTLSADGRPKFL